MRTRLADDLGLEFPIFAFTHRRDVGREEDWQDTQRISQVR